jgi:hypothetical protein
MEKPKISVAIEMSRKWDGDAVGKELVDKIIRKTSRPNFILLFTTIHYEKEFKKILSKIKESFPHSPLIGGTVAGFITSEGCFTRGVGCMSMESSDIDISIGIGRNVKKDPQKASEEFASMIKKSDNPIYKSKSMIILTSGPIIPTIPTVGKNNVIVNKKIGDAATKLLESACKLGSGHGREEEFVESLAKKFPDYYFICGSSMDDGKMVKNYQFFDREVLTNCAIGISMQSNCNMSFDFSQNMKCSDVEFNVTESSFGGRIIKKLDGKPAVSTFIEKIGWKNMPINALDKFYRVSFFYPLASKKDDVWCPNVIAGFLGDNLPIGHKLYGNKLKLLSATGKSFVDSIEFLTRRMKKPSSFAFFISCAAILETLGSDVYRVKSILDKKLTKPYILVYTGGEGVKLPRKEPVYFNETSEFLSF